MKATSHGVEQGSVGRPKPGNCRSVKHRIATDCNDKWVTFFFHIMHLLLFGRCGSINFFLSCNRLCAQHSFERSDILY